MNYIEALESYINYLRIARNSSPKTIEQYELHLWKFFEFLNPKLATNKKLPPHQQIFLGIETDPEKRTQKIELKRFLRSSNRLTVQNVKLDDLNEFRFYLTEK